MKRSFKVYEVRLKEFTDVASIIASGAEKNIAKGIEKGMDTATIAELTGLSVLEITSFSQRTSEQ